MVRRCLVSVFTFSLVALTFVGQFPVVAERNLGIDERSTAYGVLYACFGAGRSSARCRSAPCSPTGPRPASCAGLVAYSVSLTVFALLRDPAPAYPVVVVVGLTYFAYITSLSTVLQEQLADHERGGSRCGSWGSAARCRSATSWRGRSSTAPRSRSSC